MSDQIEIVIHLPPRDEDPILEGLRHLTKAIVERTGQPVPRGLGGEYGYGADYENDVFMMHHYCWCE